MESVKNMPVMKTMCPTCPFRPGSEYACLAADLGRSALSEASRICHSTGANALGGRTGKPERLCRGARDVQLQVFHRLGVIEEPTDAAWKAKAEELETPVFCPACDEPLPAGYRECPACGVDPAGE